MDRRITRSRNEALQAPQDDPEQFLRDARAQARQQAVAPAALPPRPVPAATAARPRSPSRPPAPVEAAMSHPRLFAALAGSGGDEATAARRTALSRIADGSVRADAFFSRHPFTGEDQSLFDDLVDFHRLEGRPNIEPDPLDQFAADVHLLQALVAAGRDERADPAIRAEADRQAPALDRHAIERAMAMAPDHHAAAFGILLPRLSSLLDDPVTAHADAVRQALHAAFAGPLHPDAREPVHAWLQRFAANLPDSQRKADEAVGLMQSAGQLAPAHQLPAFLAGLETVVAIPEAVLSPADQQRAWAVRWPTRRLGCRRWAPRRSPPQRSLSSRVHASRRFRRAWRPKSLA